MPPASRTGAEPTAISLPADELRSASDQTSAAKDKSHAATRRNARFRTRIQREDVGLKAMPSKTAMNSLALLELSEMPCIVSINSLPITTRGEIEL